MNKHFPKRLLIGLLAASMLFASCSKPEEDASDLGSDLSSGLSDVQSDIGSGLSDAGSDIKDGVSDMESGMSSEVSKESSDVSSDMNSDLSSGARDDVTAGTSAVSMEPIDLSMLSNKLQGWGQGTQVDEKNRPLSPLTFQKKYAQYDAYFIGEDEKKIYLTFDQGYENGYTPKILDTLKEKEVKAIFFVTMDYVKSQPELIQRMIDEGHVIGNHSDKHPSFPEVSIERCRQEVENVHTYIVENYNYTMDLFRPPKGEFSDRVLAQMQQLGYKTVLWSYAYQDWDPNAQMGADKALKKLNGALHNGAIYLLHAVSKDNAEILGDFIDYAREQEFSLEIFV